MLVTTSPSDSNY